MKFPGLWELASSFLLPYSDSLRSFGFMALSVLIVPLLCSMALKYSCSSTNSSQKSKHIYSIIAFLGSSSSLLIVTLNLTFPEKYPFLFLTSFSFHNLYYLSGWQYPLLSCINWSLFFPCHLCTTNQPIRNFVDPTDPFSTWN